MSTEGLKSILDEKVKKYNRTSFIKDDPISIPHRYSKLQDIEIAAFWTAMLSWGQRKTIINKSNQLMKMMDDDPHNFVLHHQDSDLKRLLSFKHRTFQPDDTLYFISFFKDYYSKHISLESAFTHHTTSDVKSMLIHFHHRFFSLPHLLKRTKKHVSSPARQSSCKRLNMFLRWMVRGDHTGVDFGLWRTISSSQLMIPLDVHVFKVSQSLGLLHRNKLDWRSVEELTARLRLMDSDDPVKYDFALFSMGVLEKY